MTICQYLTNGQLNKTCKLSILYVSERGADMDTDYYRKVIKEYRKKENLTQERLAELLGYDTTYMSHIETGKREPSVDFFIRFSNLSGISFDYLFCCETQIGAQIKLNEISDRAMRLLPKDRQFTFKILDDLLHRFEQDIKK